MTYLSKHLSETWLNFENSLDAASVLNVQAEAELALRKGTDIVADLSEVGFLDPSGIGLLVFLFKRQKAAGRNFRIVGVSGQPSDLLRKLRLERALGISFNENHKAPVSQPLVMQVAS